MEGLINFLSENSLWTIIIGVIAVVMIVGILRSLFKMAMIVAVIGLIMVVFLDFDPEEVIEKGKNIANTGTSLLEESNLLDKIDQEDFFIKQEDGKTIVEIESLGVKYSVDELLTKLNDEDQKKVEDMLEK